MDLAKINALLAVLNEQQAAVAAIGPGAAAVAGAPGSGKTMCLVARLSRMVRDGLDPRYILAMTFTKKAAAELSERLRGMGINGGRVGTIHSLSMDILLEGAGALLAGVRLDESGFQVQKELHRALGDLRRDKNISRGQSPDIDGIKRFLTFCKSGGPCPVFGNPFGMNKEGEAFVHATAKKFYDASGGLHAEQLLDLYNHLEHRRAAAAIYDFDDMQLWAWQLLIAAPSTLLRWQQKYSVVLIDEAQDSSRIQWDLARLLAQGASRICPERTPNAPEIPPRLTVHGQLEQSIYSWRAAMPNWFSDFATSEGVGLYTLPVNYRSTPELCWLVSQIVKDKDWNLIGEVIPASREPVDPTKFEQALTLMGFKDLHKEAVAVMDRAAELAPDGNWLSVSVLSRLAMFLHLVEIECIRRGIPYEKRASGRFFDSVEVQDLLAYLRVAGGWDPSNKWMKRCIRVPFRYISKIALNWADGQSSKRNYLNTLMSAPMLSGRQVRSLRGLEETLEGLERMMNAGAGPAKCIKHVLDDTGYFDWLKTEKGSVTLDASKVAVIDHLLELASGYSDATTFISSLDQLSAGLKVGQQQMGVTEGNRLVLSTIHRAKGLEWDHVILGNVASGALPWNKGFSHDEEVRLLYVALSRARFSTTVTWSGKKSVFVDFLQKLAGRVTDSCIDSGKRKTQDIAPSPPAV